MAILSVSDFSLFINRQIKTQEQIEAYLWRLEALLAVAVTTKDFYSLPDKILHNYFLIADDLVEKTMEINQISLRELCEQAK